MLSSGILQNFGNDIPDYKASQPPETQIFFFTTMKNSNLITYVAIEVLSVTEVYPIICLTLLAWLRF
jgi:hypothetical protein